MVKDDFRFCAVCGGFPCVSAERVKSVYSGGMSWCGRVRCSQCGAVVETGRLDSFGEMLSMLFCQWNTRLGEL